MHDGQNLFDEATSYAGEWHVDESMEELGRTGLEAIVVGIPNMQQHRADEYSPFPDARLGIDGRGAEYVAFLLETVKPLIDREFRTAARARGDRHCRLVDGRPHQPVRVLRTGPESSASPA